MAGSETEVVLERGLTKNLPVLCTIRTGRMHHHLFDPNVKAVVRVLKRIDQTSDAMQD
ncbi:uncharacterized protein CTRU02_200224 [Colletotrichum truncatum]|uniref:Uncharacterized protein n=1 Tax=Colletotrichum truncatum TaxID=5467 RepID=A0ACC3ZDX9_COLTU